MTRSNLLKIAFMLLFLGAHSQICAARNLGLLVGISNYESPAIPDLKAQPNDLRLMWDALRKRGFAKSDLIVLTDTTIALGSDAPDVIGKPTAANILKALDELAERSGEGDLVVFYYSGHGTKINQPRVRDSSKHVETDGKDEVLLAIDAGIYDYIKRELPGGIVDDVLKEKFDALKGKGAFVWVILDTCHSGGMTRAGGQNEAVREHFVDGRLLNAPVEDVVVAQGNVSLPPQDFADTDNEWIPKSHGGKLVAFLAANADQFAYEKPVPEYGDKPVSSFTYNLVSALEGRVHGTYAQLAETVVLKHLSGTMPQTPVFEGDLNQHLFQGESQSELLWPARLESSDKIGVEAGQLQGVSAGTILALVSEDKTVGFAEVTKVGLSQGVAKINPSGMKRFDQAEIKGPLLARIHTVPVSFVLNVALPSESARGSNTTSEVGFAAIERLRDDDTKALPIAWKPYAAADADVRLSILDGVIYILPPTGEIVREGKRPSRSIKIDTDVAASADRLRESLWSVLRQRNLLRIASGAQRSELYDKVDVRIKIIRNPDQFGRVIDKEEQECEKSAAGTAEKTEFTIAEAAKLKLTHCDEVEVKVINRSDRDVDVTLLYLDANYGILYQNDEDDTRVPAGTAYDPKVFRPPVKLVTWLKGEDGRGHYASVGPESLMIIIAEAGPVRRSYGYLEQESLGDARAEMENKTRGGMSPFDALIREAGLGTGRTRGGGLDAAGDATIKVFRWEVVPPAQLAESPSALKN